MASDDDRPKWTPEWTPFTKWGFIVAAIVTVVSSLIIIVVSLVNFFWGIGRRPTPTVEAIAVGVETFIIFNVVMIAWTNFGHPKEDMRRLLKRYHGLVRWLGSFLTAILTGVITELITSRLHH